MVYTSAKNRMVIMIFVMRILFFAWGASAQLLAVVLPLRKRHGYVLGVLTGLTFGVAGFK